MERNMRTTQTNWQDSPLSRAELKVISTPTKTTHEANCPGFDGMRFNVGNIHEIKKYRNMPAKG
jgi:hypothetical protein